ncbi:MAG: ATP-binding protein [Lautropia sp.]
MRLGALRVSLFWRTFALIGLLIAASFGAWYQIYRVFEREPQATRFAWEIASIVNLTRAALISTAGDRRSALLVDLARNEGVRVYPLEPNDRIEPWPDRQVGVVVEAKLQELLGPQTMLAARVNGERALWISFDIDGDPYWLIAEPERLRRQLGSNWLEVTAIAVGFALLGALLISRRINRPLANLADAIGRLSRGEQPERLRVSGTTEIYEVNRRFNRLADELDAIEADRAIVLAGVSHDIRTPLTRLRLEIEMSGLDEAAKAEMIDEIERIDSIVRQFIEFARPLEWTVEPVDVAEAIDQQMRAYARECGDGSLVINRHVAIGLLWRGSPTILQRILANLIDNALKYARPPDGGAIRVDLLARRIDTQIELVVRDHGPGVPAEAIERLARPFARLDAERGSIGGSGLGLAIVARLARRAGGAAAIENAPGGGLLVRVRLQDQEAPVSSGAERASNAPAPVPFSLSAAAPPPAPRSPRRGPDGRAARSSSPSD